jgi:beta-glucosidase
MTVANTWRSSVCALTLALALHWQPAAAAPLPWMNTALTPEQRAALLIQAMTLLEKFEQMAGQPGIFPEIPTCNGVRHVPGISRLQIPTLRITNGPVGIGQSDCTPYPPATALPSSIGMAASFNRAVATQYGDVIGTEARNLALHVLEGPGMNMARIPQGGRNFEYLGEDPFLSGTMAVQEIQAIQAHGVIAMAKHFVANDQETNRTTINEIIDDRVLHEIYLLPFEMAVKDGGVASAMCSYNSVNGPHACEDTQTLTDILRTQWGFTGYVQSDFGATHSTAPALLAGLDLEMSRPVWFTPANLQAALSSRQIAEANIDTALGRRYTQMFRLGIFDRPFMLTPIDAARDGAIAREIGEQSAVLLKNLNGFLPLDAYKVGSVALIGQAPYATRAVAGGGSSQVNPLYTVTPLQGMQNALAALRSKATATLTVVATDNSNLSGAVAAALAADVVIVLAGTISSEGRDLPSIALPNNQDAMISVIVAANPRTAVVLKDNASTLLPWIQNVPAVLEAWFPGEEDGNIVARLLLGQANPSGKLPVTFPVREQDLPAHTPQQWPSVDVNGTPTVVYSEGLQIGYRWFDAHRIAPQFPFGHGLSYTTFKLSKLEVTPKTSDAEHPIKVQFEVANVGQRAGAEVPQVYLGLPQAAGEPPKRLVGFDKVWLEPGEKKRVTICIDPQSPNHPMGTWDSAAQDWTTPAGNYLVSVGQSATNIPLGQSIVVLRDDDHRRRDDHHGRDDHHDGDESCISQQVRVAHDH